MSACFEELMKAYSLYSPYHLIHLLGNVGVKLGGNTEQWMHQIEALLMVYL